MSSAEPALKLTDFASGFEFWIRVNNNLKKNNSRHYKSNFKFLSIDHFKCFIEHLHDNAH